MLHQSILQYFCPALSNNIGLENMFWVFFWVTTKLRPVLLYIEIFNRSAKVKFSGLWNERIELRKAIL